MNSLSLWQTRMSRMRDTVLWSTLSTFSKRPEITTLYSSPLKDERGQTEFIKRAEGPVYVQPDYGYLITESGVLIEESVLHNNPHMKRPTRIFMASAPEYLSSKRGRGVEVRDFKTVISLRHFWEWNYYHFHLDVLGKLELLDRAGIDPDIPILLGDYASHYNFVKEVLSRGTLKDRNWVVQDYFYARADEVIYCHNSQSRKRKFDYVLAQMEIPSPQGDERIFLNRTGSYTRQIENIDEIRPILKQHGFREVDSGKLSVADQINIFSQTAYLFAIRGAALTNIIFRQDGPLKVLDVYPSTWSTSIIPALMHEYGHYYDSLSCQPVGSSNPQHANIIVDKHELEQRLDALLS